MEDSIIEKWSKEKPYPATLKSCYLLNKEGSSKETLHIELSIEGSGLSYKPGDCMGIIPKNDLNYVDEILEVTKLSADVTVKLENEKEITLREALTSELDISNLTPPVIKQYNEFAQSTPLQELLDNRPKLSEYMEGRQIIDLLTDYPSTELTAQKLADSLRKLSGRLYSIASSISAHPNEVHLTVAIVRYNTHGRERGGVATTYLADRVKEGDEVLVYFEESKKFSLPEDPETAIIMVGPGTGIAPFRAFVEERKHSAATGKSWLFFGDQHRKTDYLYEDEWNTYLSDGHLSKIDLAFSRDQEEKIYVQDRMIENSKEIFEWLENGAHFYVCGDATRMAKDVNQALITIVETQGEMDAGMAKKYVRQLQKDNRYQKDVY